MTKVDNPIHITADKPLNQGLQLSYLVAHRS